MSTKRKPDLAQTIERLLANQEAAKALYKENDDLWEEILEEMESGDSVAFVDRAGKRKKYLLRNKAEGQVKVWKSVCFAPYEIEVIDA